MIVISAGMQKSGSAYIYNLLNDLITLNGGINARELKEKEKLNELLKHYNNNVGVLNFSTLFKLFKTSFRNGSFCVKTHNGPTKWLNLFLFLGIAKTVYIYRDPRDVLLSAQDHGRKIIEGGENHSFAELVLLKDTLTRMKKWIEIFYAYKAKKSVLTISYEDLLNHPLSTMQKICDYLKYKMEPEQLEAILWTYNKENENVNLKGLHFNVAKTNRYSTEYNQDEILMINSEIGSDIVKMGYQL
ncbi:MAG: sulfotransferase domain-containing protein [Bacteroidetes bacterium]|nr:sulfotransferase domain-containing protein [Bacteroidota bacterium]